MMRSLFSAISGLRNHQTMMDVVGNNISNVNTTGFKSSQAVFSEVLSQTIRGAGAATGTTGGSNPAQIGLGSRVSAAPWVKLVVMPASRTPRPTWAGFDPPIRFCGAEAPCIIWLSVSSKMTELLL